MNKKGIFLLMVAAFLPFGSTLPNRRLESSSRTNQPEMRMFPVDLGDPSRKDHVEESSSAGINIDVAEKEESRTKLNEQVLGEEESQSVTFAEDEFIGQRAYQAEHFTEETNVPGLDQSTTDDAGYYVPVLDGQAGEQSSAGVNTKEDDNQTPLGYKNQEEDKESALETINQEESGSSTPSHIQGSDELPNVNHKQGDANSPSVYDSENDHNSYEAGQEGTENEETHDQDSTDANKNSQSHETGQEGTENEKTDDEDGASGDNKKLVVLVKVVWVQNKSLQNKDDGDGQPWSGHGND